MQTTRRSLVQLLSGLAISGLLYRTALGQTGQASQDPSSAKTGPIRTDDEPNAPNKPTAKAILDENQKDIKKNIEKLFDLASQLKDQVEKTDSTTVLSLAMVKKAEEIERLARQIKDRAKGS
jgi:hypothetical protein